MLRFPILALTTLAAVAAAPRAQVIPGVFGHQVYGQLGSAGEFCWSFSCTPHQLTVVSGETLTLRVNAPLSALYAIGASFSATSCLPFPGVGNRLVLDPPIATLAIGVVNQQTPMLACWGGFVQVPLTLPNGLPSGLSFTTQAVAEVPSLSGDPVSLSTPVTSTIQ